MENWKQIVELMDDEIREEIHARVVLSCYPCTEERFLEIYKASRNALLGVRERVETYTMTRQDKKT